MSVIAAFSEKKMMSWRKFELFDDTVVIHLGQTLGNLAEFSFPLKDIRREADKVYVTRSDLTLLQIVAILLFSLCAVVAFMLHLANWSIGIPLLLLGIVVWGLVLVCNPKRDEYSIYSYESGVIAFDIGHVGKEKEGYAHFVALLNNQIEKCKNQDGSD